MRVPEKYSTLPAEDRSVHIVNICAIEDLGYLPSEGTVSSVAATGELSTARKALGGFPSTHVRPGNALLLRPSSRDQLYSARPPTRGTQRPGSPECPWGLCRVRPRVCSIPEVPLNALPEVPRVFLGSLLRIARGLQSALRSLVSSKSPQHWT